MVKRVSKLIAVTDDVYNQLSKMKGGRSFSEVLKALMAEEKKRKSIEPLFGVLKGENVDEWKAQIEKDRKSWYKRRKIKK